MKFWENTLLQVACRREVFVSIEFCFSFVSHFTSLFLTFLSTTELNNSIEDYNSSRVGVVSCVRNFNMGLFSNALSLRVEILYDAFSRPDKRYFP